MNIKRYRILLVEDNPGDARLMRESLAGHGAGSFEILGVGFLSEGLALLELGENRFDAILLDLTLPDEQGLTTLVRVHAAAPATPIIIMTGMDDEELAMKAVHHGADEYMVKGEAGMNPLARVILYAIERRKAREEVARARKTAEEATKIKDKFLSLVAHDLQTPLTSLTTMLKIMAMDTSPAPAPAHGRVIGQALETAETMSALINELLDISRLQTGMVVPQPRFIDASFAVMGVLDRVGHAARTKNITLINTVPEGRRLYADLNLISEVFFNIVANAIKFTPAGGSVTVFAHDNEPGVISIGDTGTGMEPDTMKKLFRYDAKFSTPGTAGERGTGLGLPLSMDIMKAHGGDIRVESRPGRGSVFSVVLPVVKPKVLIVDDDRLMRFMFREAVSGLDIDIIEAENGRDAVKTLETDTPHLIILDILMPEMDGFGFLEYMRKTPKTKLLPVIVITSLDDMSTREKVFRLGADDFAQKPFVIEDLIPRVRRFIL